MNAVVGAVAGVWLGMVLAISFLEAPLKFRAPGITLALGLGIGRLVFAALNRVEAVLAAAILLALAFGSHPPGVVVGGSAAIAALVAQLVLVRPFLVRRSNQVLNGEQGPRSRAHHAYVALEVGRFSRSWPWRGPPCGRSECVPRISDRADGPCGAGQPGLGDGRSSTAEWSMCRKATPNSASSMPTSVTILSSPSRSVGWG